MIHVLVYPFYMYALLNILSNLGMKQHTLCSFEVVIILSIFQFYSDLMRTSSCFPPISNQLDYSICIHLKKLIFVPNMIKPSQSFLRKA